MHTLSPGTRVIALDLETTGLSATRHDIVELAAVAWQDGEETGHFQTLVNPGCPIPRSAMRIHGITDRMVHDQPRLRDVLPAFVAFCTADMIIAHNAPFDLGFLNLACARQGLPHLSARVVDTCALARQRLPGLPSYSLEALKCSLGIGMGQAHRALDDARDCLQIFFHCIQENPPTVHRTVIATHLPEEFALLREAMERGGSVCIEYRDTRGQVTNREIVPLLVTGHGAQAVVEAHCLLRNERRRFHLCRITRTWKPN